MEPVITAAAVAPASAAAPVIPAGISAAEVSAIIAANNDKLLAALKPAQAASVVTTATPVQTDSERLAFLERQNADNTAKEVNRVRSIAIDGALETAKKDYSAPQLEALKTVFEKQFGAGIVVEGDKAFYNSPETGKIDVSAQFATFLKGPIAMSLKPAPVLPGGAALDPTTGLPAAPAVQGHEWAGKTFAEVKLLKASNPQKFNDLVTKPENRATFIQIMATA